MKEKKTFTIWGVALRIIFLLWPMMLISDAWWKGDLVGLLIGIVILALIAWWAVSYALKFHRQGQEREAARQQAEAEEAERIHRQGQEREAAQQKAETEEAEHIRRLKVAQAELLEKKSQKEKEIEDIKAKIENERREREARQAEWERTHGRLVFRVAGVTKENDDGSQRQLILKEALANDGEGELGFESYDYKGQTAIHILYNDECIGNVPAKNVDTLLDILDRITIASLDVERFLPKRNEDDEDRRVRPSDYIYRADVTLVYSKDPE